MITFHNDHLVAPELCKLLYDAVPLNSHVPVVFLARGALRPWEERPRQLSQGTYYGDKISIHLQSIYYHGFDKCNFPDASLWRNLLEVCLHEFGHVATQLWFPDVTELEYEAYGWAYRAIEKAADTWGNAVLARILEGDGRLCQPARLGAYLDGRLAKHRAARRVEGFDWRRVHTFRCLGMGAQLSVGEVACRLQLFRIGDSMGDIVLDTRGVRRLAGKDIGRSYIDQAGRRHVFFVWGDIPKLAERMAAASSGNMDSQVEP